MRKKFDEQFKAMVALEAVKEELHLCPTTSNKSLCGGLMINNSRSYTDPYNLC